MSAILSVDNVSINVENQRIIERLNLHVPEGESYILFGPNGSGKSTFLNAIMGDPGYVVSEGDIKFRGKSIVNLEMDERARLGITLSYQNPPEIQGIKLKDLLKLCLGKDSKDDFSEEEMKYIERFRLKEFLDRDINMGFSGGERKRSEILQIMFLKPKLLLLDEPDSGVDVESLKLISKELDAYLKKTKSSAIIVTHRGDILKYISVQKAVVLLENTMYCFSSPENVYKQIRELGYRGCIECDHKIKCERTNIFCKETDNVA
ncbi:MAG: Fe-S cluster assembly ATPase SufC [Candidatus Helarchaeota archaeon]